jgi:hypothetical protein
VSEYVSKLTRDAIRSSWPDWLPGWTALVVLALFLILVVHREASRGLLSAEREARTRATAVVVVPLALCVALAAGSRFLQVVT